MNIMPLLTEADRYLGLNDFDRAAAMFEHAQKQSGGRSPLPLVGIARVAIAMKKVEEAAQILEGVLTKFPKCAPALSLRGVIEEAKGRFEAAGEFHSRALVLDPTLAMAHVNLGRLAAQQKKWAHAAASYQLALQHGAATPDAGAQFGTALFHSGRVTEAVRVLAHVVEAYPRHFDAVITLADVLVETTQLELAAQLLDNAAERFPKEPLIPSKRAVIALRLKDLEVAATEAWRVTTLAPLDEEAWLFAAVVDTMRLRFDTAEKALKHVLKLSPHNWRAHYHLGGLADAIKDKKEAKRRYRAAIVANPMAWEPLNNLAIMLLEEGGTDSLKEARTLLDRAVQLGAAPDAIVVRYNLALACFRLGDKEGTRRAASELMKLAPADHPMANEAKRVMKLAA
ncbi:MAG: tetratricopeptide repeat protein [Archangium sp.]